MLRSHPPHPLVLRAVLAQVLGGHMPGWLHIGCVKICGGLGVGSVSGKGVPCPLPRPAPPAPRHRHFELVLLLNQTDSDKQTGGGGRGWGRRLSIVHSGCLDAPVLTKARRRDLAKPVFESVSTLYIHHSGPPALVSFTYFISRVCEPLQSRTNSPPPRPG